MYRGYPVTKSKYYPQAGLIARLRERGITYHPLPAEPDNKPPTPVTNDKK